MTEPTKKTLRESLAETKPRDLIYPGVVLLFVIIVLVLFSLSTKFITNNINKAFSGDAGGESRTLNMDNYILVAKKLGIEVDRNKSVSTAVEPSPLLAITTTATTTATTTMTDVRKEDLTLEILNSTTKSGVASALSKKLTAAGYSPAALGNQKKLLPNTTILIKESKASFGPAILEEVKKVYGGATATTTTETADFDVTIVIGTK